MTTDTRIDLDGIAKQFSEKYFNNNDPNIKMDLIHYAEKINEGDLDTYNIYKMFIALMSYCGNSEKINLNKYFILNI